MDGPNGLMGLLFGGAQFGARPIDFVTPANPTAPQHNPNFALWNDMIPSTYNKTEAVRPMPTLSSFLF